MHKKADHSGHRKRMRARFMSAGLDNLQPHEVLEMMLYYAIPMKDTNDLAIRLIKEFGSFSAVLDAPIDLLMGFGLTENQAIYLKMMPDVCRLYINDKHDNPSKIITPFNISRVICDKFIGREEENVLLILTDSKMKELYSGMIVKGSLTGAQLSIRKIVDLCLRYNAACAILAHNHLSGMAIPSQEDLKATADVYSALRLINVHFIDHYIVADNECVSLRDSGLLNFIFEPDSE